MNTVISTLLGYWGLVLTIGISVLLFVKGRELILMLEEGRIQAGDFQEYLEDLAIHRLEKAGYEPGEIGEILEEYGAEEVASWDSDETGLTNPKDDEYLEY